MSETKKARPGEATPGARQDENAAFGEAAFSTINCTTGQPQMQTIFDLLPQGEQNAISSKSLAEIVGAPSVRELQSRVAVERENGALILSTCRGGGGYFRPSPGNEGIRSPHSPSLGAKVSRCWTSSGKVSNTSTMALDSFP